jgi:hypothetical protein
MPLWPVQLRPWPGENFGQVNPERVLVEYDGLLTFTFKDTAGNLMLAHLSDEDGPHARYIVAPTTAKDIERLEKGTVSLRGALNQPLIWLLDIASGKAMDVWCGSLNDIPDGFKPFEDAMLFPSLKPLFKLKVPDIRHRYRLGAVGATAARSLFESAEHAVAGLLSHLGDDADKYQLEAQQLAFNSIEVAFQAVKKKPSEGAKKATIGKLEGLLGEGLKWASANGEYELPGDDKVAILGAMKSLVPKPDGIILKVEVSGRVVPHNVNAVPLTTNLQAEIAKQLPTEHRERFLRRIGLVRELDKDSRSFQLRKMWQHGTDESQRFFFAAEYEKDLMRFFEKDTRVQVEGRLAGNRYELQNVVAFNSALSPA